MNISCPTCTQEIEIFEEHAGTVAACPSCQSEMALPDISEFQTTNLPVPQLPPAPVLSSQSQNPISGSAAQAILQKNRIPTRRFSFRLTGIKILLFLLLVMMLVMGGMALISQSTEFDSGFMAGAQQSFLSGIGIYSWEEYTPEVAGVIVGGAAISALFIVFALIATFKRMRKTVIGLFAVLFISNLVGGSIPFVPVIGLILSSIPGRSKVWQQK